MDRYFRSLANDDEENKRVKAQPRGLGGRRTDPVRPTRRRGARRGGGRRGQDAAERLMRSVCIDPHGTEASVTEQTLSARHILPRFSAKAQNSLRSAVDGLDKVTAHADPIRRSRRGWKVSRPSRASVHRGSHRESHPLSRYDRGVVGSQPTNPTSV